MKLWQVEFRHSQQLSHQQHRNVSQIDGEHGRTIVKTHVRDTAEVADQIGPKQDCQGEHPTLPAPNGAAAKQCQRPKAGEIRVDRRKSDDDGNCCKKDGETEGLFLTHDTNQIRNANELRSRIVAKGLLDRKNFCSPNSSIQRFVALDVAVKIAGVPRKAQNSKVN